ncbi:membrane protein [Haladaptatus litoreus]|uniref:Membrane protein n=1 Tax=Haladaptatus litoreus TaxID=553468 RepID=A0A1N7EXU8_9EURY|nr:YihY/virulence factor BrkB family protein [Haladaptatus litoreus]SIR92745.1 membrane protein [Haladaptatus litoreus]
MRRTINSVATIFRQIVRHANSSYLPFLAGSLAYHAFLLLIPLLIFLLIVISAVGGEASVAYLVDFTQPYLTPRARALLAETILGASTHTGVLVLGIGALLWSLLRIFRGLDIAFATIYNTSTHKSIQNQFRSGIIAALVISLALLMAITLGTLIAVFPWEPLVRILNAVLFVVVLIIVFFPLYYVFPSLEVTVREVLPGTVAAAIGWLIFHILFQVYAAYTLTLEAYGVLGVVLSMLIWLYSSMFILLLGAVVNAVLAGRA